MTDTLKRPSETELAIGVRGRTLLPTRVARSDSTARQALEEEIAQFLAVGTSFVSFSGGRDSSAVLAVACHVAHARGLVAPRPVILRYPGDTDSDETAWQALVLDHLDIDDPVVLDVTERSTYLDADVRASLRRHGLLFPAALHLKNHILLSASGNGLLTGEGGDEVLGTRRVTPFALLLRYRRRPSKALLSWAWAAGATPRGRARRTARDYAEQLPWITQKARRMLANDLAAEERAPLHWGRETRAMASGRVALTLAHNLQLLADEYNVRVAHPLQSPAFMFALAREGGRWGYAGRTDLMRHLFSDLLPDALLSRSTKAHFGAVRWGTPEREFARSWDGGGVPDDLVDVEALRSEWLSERPAGASVPLLHAAWLHSQGLTVEGEAA
ncbi:asparagine synthase-related protein [Rathayibacter sp. CAU 1779]